MKIVQWIVSSKTCHVCQYKVDSMPLDIRTWNCPACQTMHRDINAALTIKAEGILKLKAGDSSLLLVEACVSPRWSGEA